MNLIRKTILGLTAAIFAGLFTVSGYGQANIALGSYVSGGQVTPAAPSGGDATFNSVGLADGTAPLPSLYFTADRNTGIYRPSSDVFGIAAGGVDSAWFTPVAWQGLSTLTSGIQLYNTVDATANYQRLSLKYANSLGLIGTDTGTTAANTITRLYSQFDNNGVFFSALDLQVAAGGFLLRQGAYTTVTGSTKANFATASTFNQFGDFGLTGTSGNNVIFSIAPTYNQASGSAANTDLLIARTETAVGSGSQYFINMLGGVGGATQKAYIQSNGSIHTVTGSYFVDTTNGGAGIYWGSAGAGGNINSTNGVFQILTAVTSAASNGLQINNSTFTGAAGIAQIGTNIAYTLNQTSTASFTALKITSTETAVGSGTQNLIDAYAGSSGTTQEFTVNNKGKVTQYNAVATAGMGVGVVVANPRQTAVTNATATLATYTVPAADSTYRVSANVQVTAATTAAMTVVCTYTDETNTSRAQTIPFVQLAGTFLTSITNVTGTGPYEGATLQIRCKAGTTIVFTTAGTVSGITYNVEGLVIQGS